MGKAGCELTSGEIIKLTATDEEYWSAINAVFSGNSRHTNTYKFCLLKSILDNLLNCLETNQGMCLEYQTLFEKFAENYWGLIVKYGIRQMRPNQHQYSAIEQILFEEVNRAPAVMTLPFESLDEETRERIISKTCRRCSRYVLGALYKDFRGTLYGFDNRLGRLMISYRAYEFLLKYKIDIERLNYYSWAKFLEKVNSDNPPIYLLDKLDAITPRRTDLSIYRQILQEEFETRTCFYCGRKLLPGEAHVDHFIPWSFTKEDKIWNFVLACPSCNEKKNNRLPVKSKIPLLGKRNELMKKSNDQTIIEDFRSYKDNLIPEMWDYARMSGFDVMKGYV